MRAPATSFGRMVAISGDTVVVGAEGAELPGAADAGARVRVPRALRFLAAWRSGFI